MGYGSDNILPSMDRNQIIGQSYIAPKVTNTTVTPGYTNIAPQSTDRNQVIGSTTPIAAAGSSPTVAAPWASTGGLTPYNTNISQGNINNAGYTFKDSQGNTKYYLNNTDPFTVLGPGGKTSGQFAIPNAINGMKANGPGGVGYIFDTDPWKQGATLQASQGGGFGSFSNTLGTLAPLLMAGAPIAGLMAGGAVAGTTAGNIMGNGAAAAAGSDAGMLPVTQGAGQGLGAGAAGAGDFTMAGAGMQGATPMGEIPTMDIVGGGGAASEGGYTGLGMAGNAGNTIADGTFASTAGGGIANSSLASNMITGTSGASGAGAGAGGSLSSFLSSLMPSSQAGQTLLGLAGIDAVARYFQGQDLKKIADKASSQSNALAQPQRLPYQDLLSQYYNGGQDITQQPAVKAELDYASRQATARLAQQGLTGAGNAPITAINYANEALQKQAMPYLAQLSGNAGFGFAPGQSGALYGQYAAGASGENLLSLEELARALYQSRSMDRNTSYSMGTI